MKLGLRILNKQISEIVFKMTESEIIIKNNTIYRSRLWKELSHGTTIGQNEGMLKMVHVEGNKLQR